MTKTYKDLFIFLAVANDYKDDDKLSYAIKKVKKRLESVMETWNEKLADLQYDHASVDEKGNLMRDDKNNLKFTVPKQKEFDKAVKTLRNETFQFEPYFATELPKGLDEFQTESLIGFVIKEEISELQHTNGQG